MTRRTTIAAAFAVGTAAVLLPAATAVAYISPPLVLLAEPQSPAVLVAKGAAVDVPVEYSCTATQHGMGIDLHVTEKVGKAIASGYGYMNVTCDGATHRILVRVAASSPGTAFTKGTAAATAFISGCYDRNDTYRCGSDTIDRTIRLIK